MNILYLSKLSGNLFAGPNNSVPAQIKAQSNIDAVFWYNLNHVKRDEWVEIGCYNLDDYPTGRLKDLPVPFCAPDLVVVEELYCFPFCKILRDVQKAGIPYIIIPRSEMTIQAQRKKRAKKWIGNAVYFKQLVKSAIAIQYLSKQEQEESDPLWNKRSIIIPNGTILNENRKEKNGFDSIKGVYIGRFEKYQKGLDILIEAVSIKKDVLRASSFHLDLYGVDQEGSKSYLSSAIDKKGINDIVSVHDAVYGEEKSRVLCDADLFVLTSRFEGMPMGLIEALSYSLPAIVTTGTNMADEIEKMHAGWTSDNTAQGVAASIGSMIKSKAQLRTMGNNAFILASKYSWGSIAERSHISYKTLINE